VPKKSMLVNQNWIFLSTTPVCCFSTLFFKILGDKFSILFCPKRSSKMQACFLRMILEKMFVRYFQHKIFLRKLTIKMTINLKSKNKPISKSNFQSSDQIILLYACNIFTYISKICGNYLSRCHDVPSK